MLVYKTTHVLTSSKEDVPYYYELTSILKEAKQKVSEILESTGSGEFGPFINSIGEEYFSSFFILQQGIHSILYMILEARELSC